MSDVDWLADDEYRINIDGRWALDDLYIFPKTYEQVYFAAFSLLPHDDPYITARINYAYSSFPWEGGYSAVNFYNVLKRTVPKRERPGIKAIKYASPGFIDLLHVAAPTVALVGVIVFSVCKSINTANATYSAIYKGMIERKLLRMEVERREVAALKDDWDFIRKCNNEMGEVLLLDKQQINALHERTGNPLRTLKILLSLFRRVRVLADYELKGKANLTANLPKRPDLFGPN